MKLNLDFKTVLFSLLGVLVFILFSCEKPLHVDWPEVTQEAKPWTRWWWMGSAVNQTDLTANMQEYAEAGFGGLEITPIYGVKGYEEQFIDFLSPQWMEMLKYTLDEGTRLNLGIDLANVSGWPFGGPWIGAEDACKNVVYKKYSLSGGQFLNEKVEFIQEPLVRAVGHKVDISDVKFPVSTNKNLKELALDQVRFKKSLPLSVLMAYGENGQKSDITGFVDEKGILNWEAPAGNWNLYALFQGWHGKQVERAGPGGEGNVIDHFSQKAAERFLSVFDEAAKSQNTNSLRMFFNDSYEVDDASGESNWTPLLFEEFKNLRGYDLREFLPELFGNSSKEMNSRVLCDYRETISDLLLERFTKIWANWAKKHNAGIRNQAHGSPGNILDLYAASDIPETEGTDALKIKFASSAGHVSGKKLIACEAATWLDEHFLSNLSAVKQNLDRYMANGVNHIVYHGSPYSPVKEEWPGWLFYAAVHFAPTNSLWPDLKAINEYVATCQSFLQSGTPDNDILLYFPIYGRWSDKGQALTHHFEGGAYETSARELGQKLLEKGYPFDFVSDTQIQNLFFQNEKITAVGSTYKTIVIPACEYMPLTTMQKLAELAKNGANIIFQDQLPVDVPGLADLKNRQTAYKNLLKSFDFSKSGNTEISICKIGKGALLMGQNTSDLLTEANVSNETIAEEGLWFSRIKRAEGTCYFISNWSGKIINKQITIEASGKEAVMFDPMLKKMGKIHVEKINNRQSSIYLQLQPGETRIVQLYETKVDVPSFPIWDEGDTKIAIDGQWRVSFVEGGPSLPESFDTSELVSWTEKNEEMKKFSGTAKYSIQFDKSAKINTAYKLSLGEVHESATVILNGKKLGTLVGPEYSIIIEASLLKEKNNLDILVSNLMANRISGMDKQGIKYQKFYNINMSAKKRENYKNGIFSAEKWEPQPSGLLGPVVLQGLNKK